jgi:amidase
MHRYTRRALLGVAGISSAASLITPVARAGKAFDPTYGTATEALEALHDGKISSRELTEHVFTRIKKYNAKINAFVTLLEDSAMEHARRCDEQRAAGRAAGKLYGLPVLVKDVFCTAGVRTTSGSKSLEHYVPTEDAVAVSRLKQAGAIIVGKTNLPEFAGDCQSYNDIAGTTNNPWDLTRTPGGSTGGGAAALAMGFGFLEIGSDIGGSIRHPANFCGVYGHKPTLELVPQQGHIPPPPYPIGLSAPTDLPVVGPLARSAEDLLLALSVIAGPDPTSARAYRLQLPRPRKPSLRDYRIGFIVDDPFCPVDDSVREIVAAGVSALRGAGVQLTEGWPHGFDPNAAYETYLFLLAADIGDPTKVTAPTSETGARPGPSSAYLRGASASHGDWVRQTDIRLAARKLWDGYFKVFDAFVSPTTFVPAFKHDHGPQAKRTLLANGTKRDYLDTLCWISPATLTGCPATVAPIGQTRSGLPVGLQIMGPFLEDATPIDIALKLQLVQGGFVAPRGYSD